MAVRRISALGIGAAALSALAALSACSSGKTTPVAAPTTTSVAPQPTSSSGTASPSTTPTGTTPAAMQLTFADNGKTVTLHVGEKLHVALDSAFWTYQSPAGADLRTVEANGYVAPTPTCGGPQAAGSGCGTKIADYVAVASGRTAVVATRVSCGEAMRCTGANARFQVAVNIEP